MRFSTRVLLGSFFPFAVLLAVSFWAVKTVAVNVVRDGLRATVRVHQEALAGLRLRGEQREQRILQGVAENPALKAGLELLSTESGLPEQARNTVRDQLSELCDALQFDFMMVSSSQGKLLTAVIRGANGFAPFDLAERRPARSGLFSTGGQVYEIYSVPIYEGPAEMATLSVGELFDLARFGVPAVLLHEGAVALAHQTDASPGEIATALAGCQSRAECQVRISDHQFVSFPLPLNAGDGYEVRSLQNVDEASAGLQALLRNVFLIAGLFVLAAALGISLLASRSIARPLALMAARLRAASATGDLPQFPDTGGGAREISDLARGFSQAAQAVREGRERLTRAYIEFVGSLAQALDARDSYTAGHSRRVSEYATAIGKAMGLPRQEIETIRIGGLLHDVGKIGISDLILQKPGRLTPDEMRIIQQHPAIGRHILEKVQGMEPYLPIVELHHENWDGSGYPHGLRGGQTPLIARIVRVADAYDAMTSDRPYRRGMAHADAMAILWKGAGTETDPAVTAAFAQAMLERHPQADLTPSESLGRLARAIQAENAGSRVAPEEVAAEDGL
jgi:HD-GYP domain-containing protein (c-di-GMP phosphodiesterase class II)